MDTKSCIEKFNMSLSLMNEKIWENNYFPSDCYTYIYRAHENDDWGVLKASLMNMRAFE